MEVNQILKHIIIQECRKSLCWTNKTRKSINYKWMIKEADNQKYIIINNFKVYYMLKNSDDK
jgi:hypothetical protein